MDITGAPLELYTVPVILLRILATAPENGMSANIRPNPIRPYRDKVIMGTKMVTRTRDARKKLEPRPSPQKGNSGDSVC